MEIITSAENSLVKKINRLKQKKYRDEYGEFFIEGFRNVCDAAEACPDSVKNIVLSERAFRDYGERFTKMRICVFSDALFDKISETGSAQGVLSINSKREYVFPSGDRCVVLDRVRDPGNVGTVIRTAAACGYSVVVNNCADIYSPKVVRSTMSAILKCEIGADISAEKLKAGGYGLMIADMGGENVFSSACDLHGKKYAIVVGNEAEGVSEEFRSAADRVLALPQDGVESLNAAVAASVMMYVLRFQNN